MGLQVKKVFPFRAVTHHAANFIFYNLYIYYFIIRSHLKTGENL